MNSLARVYAKLAAALIGFMALLPSHAWACAVCMGADSKVGEAVNGAIFVMLGLIGAMLAGLAGFGFYLMKRASAPLSPHLEVAHIANNPEEQS